MLKKVFIILLLLLILGCGSKDDSLVMDIIKRRTPSEKIKERCFEEASECIKYKEYEEAEKLLKKALKVDPKDPTIYYRLGSLYELMGKDEESLKFYLKAIKLDPRLLKID